MINARSFLVPFKYNNRVDYVIEFSPFKVRFYCHNYLIGETPPDVEIMGAGKEPPVNPTYPPLFLETPYSAEDLWDDEEKCCRIQTIQHSDILYIFHEKYPIKTLKRLAHNKWVLEDLELKGGPFLPMNTTDITMQLSEFKGVYNLGATAAVFQPSDVGRLIRIHVRDERTLPWTSNLHVGVGEICFSDNKYYQAQNAGTTGFQKPVHTEDTRSDGQISWKYMHSGYVVAEITDYDSPSTARVKMKEGFPVVTDQQTPYWELGMIKSDASYPKSGAFFRNRFAFLINTPNGPYVCLSASGDYNNFSDRENGDTTAETAITVPVLSTEFNEGKWLYAGDVLFVGSGTAEFYIDTVSASAPMAADNIKIAQISHVGSKAIMPVGIGGHVFFADRYGLSLRDLMYNYYNDGYDQIDMSLLGKHLFETGIVALAYQEIPDKILWCLTDNGALTALTFSAEQEVAALSGHQFGGRAESLAVVGDFANKRDNLWLEMCYTTADKIIRTVEINDNGMPLSIPDFSFTASEAMKADYILRHAFYLDGATVFERPLGNTDKFIELPEHLHGKRVSVFADGVIYPDCMVMNGKVAVPPKAGRVIIGLPIKSRFIPQHIYIPTNSGSGIGQKQRINHVLLMLYLSGGGQIGADEKSMVPIYYRQTEAEMNLPEPLFSGNKEILFNGRTSAFAHSAEIIIENDSPLPMNILAIVPTMDVA